MKTELQRFLLLLLHHEGVRVSQSVIMVTHVVAVVHTSFQTHRNRNRIRLGSPFGTFRGEMAAVFALCPISNALALCVILARFFARREVRDFA